MTPRPSLSVNRCNYETPVSKHKLTIEDIKKMSPKEVNEKWEDIKPAHRSGEPAPADDFDEEDDE